MKPPFAFLGGLSVLSSLAFGLPLPANPPPNPPPTTPPAKTDIDGSVVLRKLDRSRPIGPYNLGFQIDPFPSLELANGEKKELTIFRFTTHFRIEGYAKAVTRMLGSASQPEVKRNREQLDKFWAIMAEFAYHQVVSFVDDFKKGGGIGRKLYSPPLALMLKRTGPDEFVAGSSARAPVSPVDLNAFSRQGKTGVFMEKCLEGTTKTGHDKNGLCGEQTAFGSEADLSTWKPPVPLTPAEGGIEGTNGCEPGTGWYAPDPKTNGPAMAVWYKYYEGPGAIKDVGGKDVGGLIGPCKDKTGVRNTVGCETHLKRMLYSATPKKYFPNDGEPGVAPFNIQEFGMFIAKHQLKIRPRKNPRQQDDPKMRILTPPHMSAEDSPERNPKELAELQAWELEALESAALEASRLPQGEGEGQAATANPPPPGVVVEPTTPPQQKTAADPLSEGMSKMSVEDKAEQERGRARLKPLRSPPSPLAGQPPPKRLSPSPGGGGSRNRDRGTESSAGGRGGGSTGGASGGGASGGNGGGGK